MHLAAEKGHTSTVEFLAGDSPTLNEVVHNTNKYCWFIHFPDKFRASVFDRTKDGSTLMHIAALNGHPETAMVLNGDLYLTPWLELITLQILFKKGVPLLMPNKSGARGIHTAASKGHVAVVNSLIVKGENVDAATNVSTKLYWTQSVIRHLFQIQDNYTALHLAVESGKSSVVEALLGHGAQVHVRGGKIGEAPLHIACRIDEAKGEQCSKYEDLISFF